MNQTWTAPQLVRWIAENLAQKGFPPPHRLEAEQLVAYALGLSRLDIYLQYDKPVSLPERDQLKELLRRRYNREPLGYILGTAHFWGLELLIGPGVLAPRPDSEMLIEACQPILPQKKGERPFRVFELGAGSLCLSLALAAEGVGMEMVALEASAEAADWAEQNRLKHQEMIGLRDNSLAVIRGDQISLAGEEAWDLIVSNPPYIPSQVIESLEPEVKDHEPRMALDGGADGLEFYRLLLDEASARLVPGGWLCFEHGYDQRKAILDLLKDHSSLKLDKLFDDYGGQPRVMRIQKNE